MGDQNELVYRDKSLTVHGHSQEHIGGDLKLRVGGIDGEGNADIVINGERKERVDKDSHLHVKANRKEQIDATWSVTVGDKLQVKVASKHGLEAGEELHLLSTQVVIEASEGLTLKGPGGFITIDAAGISVMGNLINLNTGGGAALAGSGTSPKAPAAAAEAQLTQPTPADKGS